MTYENSSSFEDGQFHQRIPYFSSPDIEFEGVIIGNAATMDNARTIRQTKTAVAFYKTPPATATITVSPSKLDFTGLSVNSSKLFAVSGLNLSGNMSCTLGGDDPNAFSISYTSWDATKGGILKVTFTGTTMQNYEATITISGSGAESKIISLIYEPPFRTDFFCGGNGSIGAPYQICTAEQLKYFAVSSTSVWDICDGKSLPFFRRQGVDCDNLNITENIKASTFTIYPNPTSNIVFIKTQVTGAIPEVKLYTIDGRLLQHIHSDVLDMSHCTAGIYFIQVNGETVKVVKH